MAFLAPAAAAASATGAATALGTAAGATTALGTGLSAGTILGTGAASSGVLGGLGLNALGGMTSILPASAGLTAAAPGIIGALPAASAALPTAGIFANPATAGFLGKSFAPLAAQTVSPLATAGTTAGLEAAKAGIIKNAMTQNAMQNAIMQNVAGGQAAQNLAGSALTSQLPGQAGNISNQMFGELSKQFARPDLGQGFQQVGSKLAGPPDVASTASRFGLETAGVKPGLKFPTELYGGQITPDMAFKTMGEGASGLLPQTSKLTQLATASPIKPGANFLSNLGSLIQNPSLGAAGDYVKEHPYATAGAAYGLYNLLKPEYKAPAQDKGMIRPYEFAYNPNAQAYAVSPTADSREQVYFNPVFTAQEPTRAKEGGIMALAIGGPVEQMAARNAVGANTGYPMAGINTSMYSNPMIQRPEAVNVLAPSSDAGVGAYSGEPKFAKGGETTGEYKYSYDPKTMQFTQIATPAPAPSSRLQNQSNPYQGALLQRRSKASTSAASVPTAPIVTGGIAQPAVQPAAPMAAQPAYTGPTIPAYQTPEQQLGLTDFYAMMDERLMGGYAAGGGISDLGNYSDGGRLLRGPGDGVSDSIPAVIGNKQPARLADGEFVIPARIVSELGNGSTEAGARKLYAMMDRVQKARSKTVGKNKVAANTRADKHLPA